MSSIDLNDPVAVLLAAISALKYSQIETAVYGGLALAVYGEARETKDADLAVSGIETPQAETALRGQGFDVVPGFDRMKFGGQFVSRLTLVGGGSTNTVDLVEARSRGYADRVLARAIVGELRGQTVHVVAPEDFVTMKILATRDRDLEDAAAVIRSVGTALDMKLVNTEIQSLSSEIDDHDIGDRWKRVLVMST